MYDNQNNQVNITNEPKCPNCGAVIPDQKLENCLRCGYMFTQPSTSYKNFNNEVNESSKKASIFLMVLSIINCLIIFPVVLIYMGGFAFFAPFSSVSDLEYNITLFLGVGYAIASMVGLIAFIINAILKGRKTKACLIVVLISFCLGVISPIVIQKLDFNSSKAAMKKNEIEEDRIVYQEDNLVVKLNKINYEDHYINVYFDFETTEIDNYNLPLDFDYRAVRVNNCVLPSVAFRKTNQGDNNYVINIKYSDLKFYNIDELYTVDFEVYNKEKGKYIPIEMIIKEEDLAVITDKVLNGYEMIYKNQQFELYMNPNIKYNYADLYVKSLVPNNYLLNFDNPDFDTPGYVYRIFWDTSLNDYSIIHDRIDFGSCKTGLKYAKFNYTIRDNGKVIKNENVEVELKNIKCLSN